MKSFGFFLKTTGRFHSKLLLASCAADAENNCPLGYEIIEGQFDPLSQRVNLATGEVIDYQPEQPSADHEWNVDARRWRLKPEVVERNNQRATAQQTIATLEAQQPRAMRELAIDPNNADALQRLQSIDAAIADQRRIIQSLT